PALLDGAGGGHAGSAGQGLLRGRLGSDQVCRFGMRSNRFLRLLLRVPRGRGRMGSPLGLARLIRVIDIETTGTDPASDAILEIASVDLVRGGGITNAMDTLVRPGKPIPPGASAVHHIVDEDVQRAPT